MYLSRTHSHLISFICSTLNLISQDYSFQDPSSSLVTTLLNFSGPANLSRSYQHIYDLFAHLLQLVTPSAVRSSSTWSIPRSRGLPLRRSISSYIHSNANSLPRCEQDQRSGIPCYWYRVEYIIKY